MKGAMLYWERDQTTLVYILLAIVKDWSISLTKFQPVQHKTANHPLIILG